MAHFYASIQGSRGGATRCGTPNSGIEGHIRGWNVGVRVDGEKDKDGDDVFEVFATSGSTGAHGSVHVGTVRIVNGQPGFVPAESGRLSPSQREAVSA